MQSINEVAEKTLHKAGRSRKAKNPVPWWTQEYQEAVRERNKYRNRLSRHFKKEDLDLYLKKKAYAQKVKRETQKAYWSKYCQSLNRLTNLGKVWEMVKGVQRSNSKKYTFSNLITEDKKPIQNTQQKADLIAKAFKSIDCRVDEEEIGRRNEFEKEILNTIEDSYRSYSPLNEEFTHKELIAAIKDMKNSTAGSDGIRAIMIQHLPESALKLILLLFNEIWNSSIFPSEWYRVIQIPILKPDKDPTNPLSYRPISLTPTFSKLMERLVKQRLMWFMERNSILTPLQSGFRKNRSTVDQLLRLETDIQKGLVNKEYTIVIFIDLEKAYDLLWRKGIVYKCFQFDIKGKVLRWINTFFKRSIL